MTSIEGDPVTKPTDLPSWPPPPTPPGDDDGRTPEEIAQQTAAADAAYRRELDLAAAREREA